MLFKPFKQYKYSDYTFILLKEYLEKSDIKKCLTIGSIIASKIIQKIGARLE